MNATNHIALQAIHTRATLSNVPVLHDVSVQFVKGRWTSVVGPNGAGKSTLLKVLAGVLPFTGRVELNGQSISDYMPKDRAKSIAWLGQNEASTNDLTVWDVALLGRVPHQTWLAAPSRHDHAVVEQALRSTQAWEWRNRVLGQLSGGERQRVLLARALAVQADVLLMDEPLLNLDPPHQSDWIELVHTLTAQGKTVVSVLHEATVALQADDMVIMDKGTIKHAGSCSDAATHLALEQVFQNRISIKTIENTQVALPNLKRRLQDLI